jgi:hypothetical protein
MQNRQLKVGDIIFHKDLQKLLLCRDKFFNLAMKGYPEEWTVKDGYERYVPDNSGPFHQGDYKITNDFTEFEVKESFIHPASDGHYCHPEYSVIICHPVNDDHFLIHVNLDNNFIAHTINSNDIQIKKE